MTDATVTLARYFAVFNAGDIAAALDCVVGDVAHHVNEGEVRHGKAAFTEFCAHMSCSYTEELTDIVLFSADSGNRGAAEFTVNGTYLSIDEGLPTARGQTYVLLGASMMSVALSR